VPNKNDLRHKKRVASVERLFEKGGGGGGGRGEGGGGGGWGGEKRGERRVAAATKFHT